MKNTKFIFISLIFLTFICVDAFSQLRPKSRSGGSQGGCVQLPDGNYRYCTGYRIPVDNLSLDYSNVDNFGCNIVNNFGCDLYIGLTYEGNGTTTYEKITNCVVQATLAADNYDPDDISSQFALYPTICIETPLGDKFNDCLDILFEFSLDLYCRDENGEFTPISSMAGINNDGEIILPDGILGLKVVNRKQTWTSFICCEEGIDSDYELGEHIPVIGQNDDGSIIFIRNAQNINMSFISLFEVNYQKIELQSWIEKISNDEYRIDLSNLDSGIYFMRIRDNDSIYSKTIIKM